MTYNRLSKYLAILALAMFAVVGVVACSPKAPDGELRGVNSLLSQTQKTATRTAYQAVTATIVAVKNATATADWLPTGRRSLTRDYTEWHLAGTLVARYTATPTSTPTLTPTATLTPTPVPPTATP